MSEKATATVEPDEVRELTADSRGRINLGQAHANERVRVAVEYLNEESD
jgi:hypothetical protein